MADIIDFPVARDPDTRPGYTADVIEFAGEAYGATAIDEFEGDYEAALASLKAAQSYVAGRILARKADRILGPRRGPGDAA